VSCVVLAHGPITAQRNEVDTMSTLHDLQVQIGARMRRGESFDAVENDLIEPAALSDAEKSALWLYGWSYVHWRRQRREALSHIEMLDRRDTAPNIVHPTLRAVPDEAFAH
jgi:hypothetical protein